jgi:hypothetical protein
MQEKTRHQTMLGAYRYLAEALLSADPKALSLRRPEFRDLDAWRLQARAKVAELVACPETGAPSPEVVEQTRVGDVEATRLRWQLPYGPPTEALLLKPQKAVGSLPGVLALHDHGGLKYFGWRKIADDGAPVHPVVQALRDEAYGGRAWANELARRGYVVLCHDVFLWGSRRIRLSDVPERVRWNGVTDPHGHQPHRLIAFPLTVAAHGDPGGAGRRGAQQFCHVIGPEAATLREAGLPPIRLPLHHGPAQASEAGPAISVPQDLPARIPAAQRPLLSHEVRAEAAGNIVGVVLPRLPADAH